MRAKLRLLWCIIRNQHQVHHREGENWWCDWCDTGECHDCNRPIFFDEKVEYLHIARGATCFLIQKAR